MEAWIFPENGNTDFYFHSQWENKYKAKTQFLIQAKLQQTSQKKGRKESNIFLLVTHPTNLIWLYICGC